MSTQTKIVDINAVRSQSEAGAAASTPSLSAELQQALAGQLKPHLQALFDRVDDALFELSERPGTNVQRNLYFDAMREIRLKRKAIAKSYLVALLTLFRAPGKHRIPAHGASESAGDGLQLLDNEALEMQVALETMVNRCHSANRDALACLEARLLVWLKRSELEPLTNPMSVESVCNGFANALDQLSVPTPIRLVILKLFEQNLLANYGPILESLNHRMAKWGILPELKTAGGLRHKETGQGGKGQASAATSMPVGGADLGHYVYAGTLDQAVLASLSSLQHAVSATAQQAGSYGLQDLHRIWQESLRSAGVLSSTDQHENTINLVSLLFEFVLDDRQLQPTMKALIARLQIPILKIALMDSTFFSSKSHPARKLLNEISKAAIGWVERQDGKKDLFKEKVESIVYRLLNEFENDPRLFADILQEFQAFVDLERRRLEIIEQRVRDAEEGKAISELAQHVVDITIAEVRSLYSLPVDITELVDTGWRQVLMLNYLRHGPDSAQWQAAVCTLRDLGWSLEPRFPPNKPVSAVLQQQAHERLIQMIPGVIERLGTGLAQSGMVQSRVDALLATLAVHHAAAMERLAQPQAPTGEEIRQSSAPVAPLSELAPARLPNENAAVESGFSVDDWLSDSEALISEVEAINQTAKAAALETLTCTPVAITETGAEAATVDARYYEQIDSFRVGAWFESLLPGQDKLRCKLAAQIKVSGKYIFVNRNGVKVREYNRHELAQALSDGVMRLLEEGLLFDRALESVIGSLRKASRGAL